MKIIKQIKIKYHADIEHIKRFANGDWTDLRAAEDVELKKGEFKLISLGVSMQLPEGYEAIVAPRSSTFKNYGIIPDNSIGIIDESYCGDNDVWRFPAMCLQTKDFKDGIPVTIIKKGDRICQFRIIKHQPTINIQTVDTLGNADRGGIGSSGVK